MTDYRSESYDDYLKRAQSACEAGDEVLGMHLYLAAYEKAATDPDIADGMALEGLRKAWNLACDLKERSMAEYVFEKLEPYLTGDEIAECANELQNLALDRLAEYGFSREELADMAEMISQDIADGDGSFVKVESISIPHIPHAGGEAGLIEAIAEPVEADPAEPPAAVPPVAPEKPAKPEQAGIGRAPADFNPYDEYDTSSVGKSYHAATVDGSGAYYFTRDKDREAEAERSRAEAAAQTHEQPAEKPEAGHVTEQKPEPPAAQPGDSLATTATTATTATAPEAAAAPPVPAKPQRAEIPMVSDAKGAAGGVFNYHALAGYGDTIALMRDFGVGLQRDPAFQNFLAMMNARHGLDRAPALDTLLFRSSSVEDATRFVDATIGELGLPVLRMSMEDGAQGMPVLCVTTQGDNRPRMNHSHNRFDGPGILVIDDLDMWAMPQPPEGMEGIAGFVMANMSRGAREAVNLIHSAVEDPDVFVLVTATTQGDPDPFFYELLEPMTIIDIPHPSERERDDIWNEILRDHPSMRGLNRGDLQRLSAGLSRYDIYMAARAAIEDAYKAGLMRRMFMPVTPENMFDKLAACQPLDSDEYRAIEEAAVRSFRDGLDDLEGLIDGPVG